MKQLLKASLFSVLAAAPFLSLNAQAGQPMMYTQQTPASTVRVLVYQDGQPAVNAKVKLYSSSGDLRREYTTNNNGRVVISNLAAPGPFELVAETRSGKSMPQNFSRYSGSEK
ncbi:carboxypeptidase-like regulatory domain-containing protein [Parendozoicomonas sp. Alg238-R29]|uniref:carboxypeptidase-like regulatory domain-containing protein n=1 Tax=Parendozoicomonas sp. Alg238-R29 TaxID=2993446 RepID=UPI00248E6684|nr:carboxypeptidase-like regulatory domain-containing protein [Parendozoicomonas sp. Alg238-R29]